MMWIEIYWDNLKYVSIVKLQQKVRKLLASSLAEMSFKYGKKNHRAKRTALPVHNSPQS